MNVNWLTRQPNDQMEDVVVAAGNHELASRTAVSEIPPKQT
jgi:hypothetical protein